MFVEQQNNQRLNELEGEMEEFKARDHETYVNGKYLEGLRKNCPAPEVLQLKIGAQVISPISFIWQLFLKLTCIYR